MRHVLVWLLMATGLMAAEMPADGVIRFTDYGYRDWGPEIVNFTVDTNRFPPATLRLLGPDGQPVPCQVDGDTLSFVASVPKGQTVAYKLTTRPAASDLTVTTTADGVILANSQLQLRLPAVGEQAGAGPAALSSLPPPVTAWGPPGGELGGGAHFLGDLQVSKVTFRMIRQGPAVAEYEARYEVAGGEYVVRVTLGAGMPIALVSEEWNLPVTPTTEHWLVLDLNKGWQADTIGWDPGAGEQLLPKLQTSSLAELAARKRKAGQASAPVGGVGDAPANRLPDGAVLLGDCVPAGKWGGKWGAVQVWQNAPDGTPARRIGWAPLHAGSWRRTLACEAWSQDDKTLSMGLPIGNRPIRWSIDIADDFSPFSSHEHDEGLQVTYGRREWGLYVGDMPGTAQAQFGYIGLDRYKEWVVDWLDTAGTAAYPGGFFNPEQVAKLKTVLDQHPDADYLRQFYLISGNPEHAAKHAQAVIEFLRSPYQENDFYLVGLSNYRKSQFLTRVNEAEDALACPELPPELRQELRRRLALYAYVTSDPDFNPRGAGVHLGNNNMTINRTLALTYFAGLLPDHPRYGYWMECARAYARFKFATQTSVDGAWVACPTYQLYSPTRTLNTTQIILRNRGIETFSKYHYEERTLRYLANMLVQDARFPGWRVIPGMGNSANQKENVWGFAMAAFDPEDDATAGWLRWVYEQATGGCSFAEGPNHHDGRTAHPFWYLPYVPEKPEPMHTDVIPTYGVIFRDGFGTDHETAMLFRTGVNWSHWDTDSLNLILYANGAPLSPGTGYQYLGNPMQQDTHIVHNRVKVGERDAQIVFGRVDAALDDYATGPFVDYAMADHFFPKEIFKQYDEPMHWQRHVCFVKPRGLTTRPAYFAIRDSFSGPADAPTWWTWLNLGTADMISVDGTAFDAAKAPANKVVPIDQMPVLHGQTILLKTAYGTNTWMWFDRPVDVRVRMTATYNAQDGLARTETKTLLEIPSTVGTGYQYVVVPLRDGQAPPACERLDDGQLVVTWPDGKDSIGIDLGPTHKTDVRRSGAGPVTFNNTPSKHQTVELPGGIEVTGEGPFTARLDGQRILIETQGRARLLHVTKPDWMIRPQYFVDGQEWMACWTDYPASGWGTFQNTNLVAISVPPRTVLGDKHSLELRNMVFPLGWDRPFTPLIESALK